MKLSSKLSLIGLVIYIFFCLLALWSRQREEVATDVGSLNLAGIATLFFAGFFLPGFLMSLAWAIHKQSEASPCLPA